MPKKSGGYTDSALSETGKWNSSKEYSSLMIMKLLYECNQYQTISYHGSGEIIDDFVMNQDDKVRARLFAIERFITTLKMLLSNTIGQIKPINKNKFSFFKTQLTLLANALPSVKYIRETQSMSGSTQWIEINEKAFGYILDNIISIYEKVSETLTDEDLVYYNVEEFDPDKAKEEFMKKFVEEG